MSRRFPLFAKFPVFLANLDNAANGALTRFKNLWKAETMKRFLISILILAVSLTAARADGRAGVVEWSDGHKQTGAISLTAGKDLRIFSGDKQVSLTLDEVKEIRFTAEKEQMWEGFYFPNAGQATQVKTGEVYPIRYIKAEIFLGNGQVLAGHLATTVFYIENDDGAQKVVVLAKQSGTNGKKMAELLYPTAIRFDAGAASSGSAVIDLTAAALPGAQPPVILTQPDLTALSAQQTAGKPIWTVPTNDPTKIFLSVEAADGIHVAWPEGEVDADRHTAVDTGLRDMRDFYDTRTSLGSFAGADGTDIFSLVMMKRLANAYNGDGSAFPSDQTPWSLVILHWKYDPDTKKATLLHRAMLAIGRITPTAPEPKVIRDTALAGDISRAK
jgi:hypothetical protein